MTNHRSRPANLVGQTFGYDGECWRIVRVNPVAGDTAVWAVPDVPGEPTVEPTRFYRSDIVIDPA